MAADKIVDSTRLDAQMTATANAIRAKSGASVPLTWDWENDTGFADAVVGIGTRCPRVEKEMIFQQATFLANTMSWTVTAVEET